MMDCLWGYDLRMQASLKNDLDLTRIALEIIKNH